MKLVSKAKVKVVYKEVIEYTDKKTGEIKHLYKLYLTDLTTGIQEQTLVKEKIYNTIEKGTEGIAEYEKTDYGCNLTGITAVK